MKDFFTKRESQSVNTNGDVFIWCLHFLIHLYFVHKETNNEYNYYYEKYS